MYALTYQYMTFFGSQTAEDRFTEATKSYLDDVYRFSLYMLRNKEDAEDVANETFLTLYEQLAKLDTDKPLKPWLIKVAKNKCLDHIKKKKSIPFLEVEDVVAQVPDSDTSLEAQFDSQDFLQKAKDHISDLHPTLSQILLLKYFEDYTFAQIAEVVELPENTVKSHFYRAQKTLYEKLKQVVS